MSRFKSKLLSIIIVILTVILFVTVIVMFNALRERSYHYESSVKMMYNELSRGEYENLASDYRHNIREGVTAEKKKEYTAVYAVAEYYIQASRARVFEECGYIDELKKSKAAMEECRIQMGDIAYCAEDIDNIFELN